MTQPSSRTPIYLDHAATTPVLPQARAALADACEDWANPSSPHGAGRRARAVLEDARTRIAAALGWDGHVIFTSGASEALALAMGRFAGSAIHASAVEHGAVLRQPHDGRCAVDGAGLLAPLAQVETGALYVVQHVNNETGVIQPVDALAAQLHGAGALLLCDCAQSAGKLPLPVEADMIVISAHKFGGAPGAGALLIRDLALLNPSGGQERGYRGGTENVPAIRAMATALECDRGWMERARELRAWLDDQIMDAGGDIIARDSPRIATIASYRMPGVPARAQLVQFDMAGIGVSAGAACASGSLKSSPILAAMGIATHVADEVIRVSFGPSTTRDELDAFMARWRAMAERGRP